MSCEGPTARVKFEERAFPEELEEGEFVTSSEAPAVEVAAVKGPATTATEAATPRKAARTRICESLLSIGGTIEATDAILQVTRFFSLAKEPMEDQAQVNKS
jgi:hypothetical protein